MFSITVNSIALLILSIFIIICSIGLIISIRFQITKNKKYKDCLKLIQEKEGQIVNVKSDLTYDEIKNIDNSIDVNKLMTELYDKYLDFENRLGSLNSDFDDILVDELKKFYYNKIKNMKQRNICEVTDNIELIGYSIIDFSKDILKFRVTIKCNSYKKHNNVIISGSDIEKLQRISIIEYKKINNNWLISNYERLMEKKLSN